MLDPDTRTVKARCVFDNADRALGGGMYATMRVKAEATRALAIPRAALVKLGEYQVVLVRLDRGARSRFARVPVDVDDSGVGAWLPVRHGVDVGQEVVVSGGATILQRL